MKMNEFHFFSNSCYDKANRDDTGIKTGGPGQPPSHKGDGGINNAGT